MSYLEGSSDKTAQRFVKQMPGNCNLIGILGKETSSLESIGVVGIVVLMLK